MTGIERGIIVTVVIIAANLLVFSLPPVIIKGIIHKFQKQKS